MLKRSKAEAGLAILMTVAILIAGGIGFYFVATLSVFREPGSVPSQVATAPAADVAAAVEHARKLTRELVVTENTPALSVAVAREGHILWAEAFGFADVDTKKPATPVTRFRLGSVSKALTGIAVAVLHDRGRLDLNAPVQQYVKGYPAKPWPLTTRHLTAGVAGLQHLRGDHEAMPDRHCSSLADAVPIFAGDPLRFKPGTKYHYSFYDWILTSAVVEGAAGEPFATFMNRDILAPLGMTATVLEDGVRDASWASLYFPRMAERPNLGLQEAPEADYSCWAGGGAFSSTPSDLARLGSAMLQPGLLKADTLSLFRDTTRLESGESTSYAMGWKQDTITLAGAPAHVLSQRGNPMGGTVSLMIFPDHKLVVAVAANVTDAGGLPAFAQQLACLFAAAKPQPAPQEPHSR
jgi:serine beta-lactamase-like protein LACTB, mitochondrial